MKYKLESKVFKKNEDIEIPEDAVAIQTSRINVPSGKFHGYECETRATEVTYLIPIKEGMAWK